MPESLSKLYQRFREYWKNLEKSQKTRIYLTFSILAVTIIAAGIWLARVNYVPLVSNADARDVKEMIAILDGKNIKYRLTYDKTGILVDSRQNDMAQVALIDYPKSGMTFEDALKLIKLNTTESDKKKLWNEYAESKISNKIKMLGTVKDAWVSLTQPEPSFFNEEVMPTAAVTVVPKETLTPKQVQGIIMIVARSVENLDPKRVTVVDDNLNELSANSSDSAIDKANNQEELRVKRGAELENKVYSLYSGQSNVFDTIRVVANPVLDFDSQKSQKQDIANPEGMDKGALVSKRTKTENLQNIDKTGVPSMDSNSASSTIPSYQTSSGTDSSYKMSDNTENYDYTRTVLEQEKALGVMLPEKSTMAVTLWYGKRVKDDNQITTEFLTKFRDDISKATGIPAANISVNKYPLAVPETIKTTITDTIKNLVADFGFFTVMLFLVIGLLLAAIPKRKTIRQPVPVLSEAGSAASFASASANGSRYTVNESTDDIPEIDLEERSEVKKQIDKFVKQKPDAVAQLLRNWIADDWD